MSTICIDTCLETLSSIDPFLPTELIPWTLRPLNVFILLNGWICLHGVLD